MEKYENMMNAIRTIRRQQREAAELVDKLERSVLLQNTLRSNGVIDIKWPVTLQFSGNIHETNTATFRDRNRKVILEVPENRVSILLWPEPLRKARKLK